ncbi:MAG: hypothetical protein E7318_06065 [Clostridiales bacterium]|nr:hypothetical protein [Clostridiales bacterium]
MRHLALLMLLLLLPTLVICEETAASAPLPAAASAQEVEQFLLMPSKFNTSGVKKGYIRYISQNDKTDDAFRKSYWLGGPEGSIMDLTLTERQGIPYAFHAGNMCSRAIYSMALSYLGIDMTPGDMSAMMNSRNLDEPYDMISWKLGLERISSREVSFNDMFDNYVNDDSYSPIYLYFRRPNGTCHSVLVVAREPDTGRFLVVDANAQRTGGKLYRVYFISLNLSRNKIINSTFRKALVDSEVLQVYQWRMPDIAE